MTEALRLDLWFRGLDEKRREVEIRRADAGSKTPLDEWPELDGRLSEIYQAFWNLSGSRPVGFGGAGPIPWEASENWLDRHGIDDLSEREEIKMLWAALDGKYLETQAVKITKGAKGDSEAGFIATHAALRKEKAQAEPRNGVATENG